MTRMEREQSDSSRDGMAIRKKVMMGEAMEVYKHKMNKDFTLIGSPAVVGTKHLLNF